MPPAPRPLPPYKRHLPKLIVQVTLICLVAIALMINVSQRFYPWIGSAVIISFFIAAWYASEGNPGDLSVSNSVVKRFVQSLVMTLAILVALPVAAMIALYVLCIGVIIIGGAVGAIR